MALRVTNKLRSEGGAQAIRFGLQQGFHELSAFALIQVDRPITGDPLDLVDHGFQRVPGAFWWGQGDGVRPIGSDYQDAAARQAPPEVEEEAGRTGICPLQIVQDQEQRVTPRQELQDTGHLSEEIGLLQGELTVPGFATRRLPQPTELVLPCPSHRLSRKAFGAEDQAGSWHEGIEKIGAGLQQRRNCIGQNSPQTSGMLGRQSRRSPLRLDVAAEQLQDLAEGQIRVADARPTALQ